MMRKSSFSFLSIMAMALIAIPIFLAAESPSDALRSSRVVAPVNENQLVTLGGHVLPWAKSVNDLGAAPDSMRVDLHLVLKRSDAQESALQTLLAQQQNPKSADYRKWLTPDEYGNRFGIADSDLAKVTTWLTSHGFVIDKTAKGNNLIRFSGTHAQLKQALHTTLHQYKLGSELHYANATNPMIPAALAPVIVGFYGLNDMKPKPMHTTPKLATRKKGDKEWHVLDATPGAGGSSIGIKPEYEWQSNNRTWHLLGPGDFATIYGVQPVYDTYDGTGQTIAIVAASDIQTKDVDSFRATFGLPPTKLNMIYDGPNPGVFKDYEGEADLDVQYAGAIAKNATIDLVVSNDPVISAIYVVDNNLAPVLSISWGQCELYMQIGGNALISELYAQAASQGITVVAAAGDASSAGCDQGAYFSSNGLSVSGLASTPYNVAVGGTDFPVNTLGTPSTYWNSTNNSSDLHSAKSYVPEAPWNQSCASPQVLAMAQTYTPDGTTYPWAADTTNEMLCNDSSAQDAFLSTSGGGGGVSACTDTDTFNPSDCKAGYPQPDWQLGVSGVTADSRRHLPDVSFFSGAGMFLSAYLYCESDAPNDASCDGTLNFGGGTSFAAPAFAGIVALLNQKTNSRLGNINYMLYELADQQFKDPAKKVACQVGTTTTVSDSSCIFHDVAQGNIRVPCYAGTTDNPPSGVCTPNENSSDQFGILSGYDAGAGYDMASGLGSLNVFNLFTNWPSNFADSQTTLTLTTGSSVNYGMKLGGTVKVAAAADTRFSSSAPLNGLVTLMYKDATGNALGAQDATELVDGAASLSTLTLPAGTYQLYARYAGDATYAPSASAEQTVTISPAVTTLEVSATRTSVGERQSTQLTATIKAASLGNSPSGTVVFTNTTTGRVIDTVEVSGYTDPTTGYSYAKGVTHADVASLVHGNNQITATFSGGTNYAGATASATVQYTGGFSIAASSTSLTLSPAAASGNTLVITLTPSQGLTLSPSSINFSCPGTMPDGVRCQFSPPSATPSGSVYTTLTFLLSSPLAQNSPGPLFPLRGEVPMYLSMVIMGGLFVAVPRKRSAKIAIGLVLVLVAGFSFGCSGGSHKSTTPALATTTITLSASSTTPALNSPVTLAAKLSNAAATGTISYFDGPTLLGTATVSNGAASLTTSSLPVGARSITATYSGDSVYPAATASAVAVDVTFTSTITAQAVDVTSGNFAQQSVILTVK